jgi:hypothetical protein
MRETGGLKAPPEFPRSQARTLARLVPPRGLRSVPFFGHVVSMQSVVVWLRGHPEPG